MDCEKLRASLYAFLDGELDVKDTIEAEQHISSCPMCEALVRYEERFRKAIRAVLPREPIPASLRERISASLDSYQQSRLVWLRKLLLPGFGLAAAAVVAAIILAVISFLPPASGPPRAEAKAIMEDAVDAHLNFLNDRLPVEYPCRDVNELAEWFRTKLEFSAQPPLVDAEPLGGRLHHLKGFAAACFFYRCPKSGEKQFSVFELDANCIKLPRRGVRRFRDKEYIFGASKGMTAVVWVDNGVAYLMVGNASPEPLLARLFPRVQSPAGTPALGDDVAFRHVSTVAPDK